MVIEVRDEVGPDDLVLIEDPPGHHVERLGGNPLATYSMVEPIEGFRSPKRLFEVNADLPGESEVRGHRDRKTEQAPRPEFQSPFDPLPGLSFGHGLGHEGEAGDVRVLTGQRDIGCIVDPKRSQDHPWTGQGHCGREFDHATSLVDFSIGEKVPIRSSDRRCRYERCGWEPSWW
ncbi:MAG: hypothetical protein WBV89_12955 [Ilumatobacter sp.]